MLARSAPSNSSAPGETPSLLTLDWDEVLMGTDEPGAGTVLELWAADLFAFASVTNTQMSNPIQRLGHTLSPLPSAFTFSGDPRATTFAKCSSGLTPADQS